MTAWSRFHSPCILAKGLPTTGRPPCRPRVVHGPDAVRCSCLRLTAALLGKERTIDPTLIVDNWCRPLTLGLAILFSTHTVLADATNNPEAARGVRPIGFQTVGFAASPRPMRLTPEMLRAPAIRPASGFHAEGQEALFFDGLPWKGKPTRVFAWVGMPKLEPGKKAPGIVLVHGGGGTAFEAWVRLWMSRGYAAIAMDTCRRSAQRFLREMGAT